MKLEKFAAKPKLVELIIDDADIVETYGETVTFYMYDIVNMNVYFEFFKARADSHMESLVTIIRKLILNAKGEAILVEGIDLPMDLMAASIVKVGEVLGKSLNKKSTLKTGEVPS